MSINEVSVRFFLQIQRHLADLPGKAMSLNMKQFNGSFGCSMCLHPGKMLEGSRSTRVYPFNPNPTPHRNCTDSILHAQIAERTGITTFGFKEKSPVQEIVKIPDQALLCYMHLALEGEAKRRLTKLFLSPSAVASANVTDLSFRLLNTKVPQFS